MSVTLLSQIVNIEERRITGTNDSTYWYGSVRIGANVIKVQDQVLQFNGTTHLQYKRRRSLSLLLLDGNFLRAGNQDFNKKGFAHLRHNYKLSDPVVTEAYLQMQYNKLLLIINIKKKVMPTIITIGFLSQFIGLKGCSIYKVVATHEEIYFKVLDPHGRL